MGVKIKEPAKVTRSVYIRAKIIVELDQSELSFTELNNRLGYPITLLYHLNNLIKEKLIIKNHFGKYEKRVPLRAPKTRSSKGQDRILTPKPLKRSKMGIFLTEFQHRSHCAINIALCFRSPELVSIKDIENRTKISYPVVQKYLKILLDREIIERVGRGEYRRVLK
jgi:predicted transcriptional regulator